MSSKNWQAESAVLRRLITTLSRNGFVIEIDDGEVLWRPHEICTVAKIMEVLDSVEVSKIFALENGTRVGSILIVRGNSPEEVVADYGCASNVFNNLLEDFTS